MTVKFFLPPRMEFFMGFPVISPVIVKELAQQLAPLAPDEFCDAIVSPYAVEYAPMLSNPDVVRKLMETKEILAYNMTTLDDEQSKPFIAQSEAILNAHPVAAYYWQIRILFMGILQNRNVNLEKRFLLLNYAVKTVQGMIDKGQPDLIPKFIEDFVNPERSYESVLKYFKDVRPVPAYSLADGISLLKSLVKPNAEYKDVLNNVYKSLGVSGPETLRMADLKKYIGMRKQFSELAAGEKSHYIENVAVSYVWNFTLPFSDPEFNFWDHFVFFGALYNAVKVMITCYTPECDDEKFVKAITAFDAAVRATGGKLLHTVINTAKNAGQNNNGDLAILTLS
ncbi:MAG: hypothetical protein NC253_04755 [Ruminococcus sp.]|nr:hypothetical protein [Ruminococcus sp.]MCM1479884.1 hypothetical protein [Muribaculaceae bacterium]